MIDFLPFQAAEFPLISVGIKQETHCSGEVGVGVTRWRVQGPGPEQVETSVPSVKDGVGDNSNLEDY